MRFEMRVILSAAKNPCTLLAQQIAQILRCAQDDENIGARLRITHSLGDFDPEHGQLLCGKFFGTCVDAVDLFRCVGPGL